MERSRRTHWAAASAVNGVIGLDSDGAIVSWNASARRIFGYPSGDVLGRPFKRLFPALHRMTRRLAARKRKRARVEFAELSTARKDGRPVEIEVSILSMEEPRGGKLVVVRDISERKRLERGIQARLRALEGAQDLGRLASWSWNVDKDEITWSKELYRMLGVDRSVARASYRGLLARVPREERARFKEAVDATLRFGAPFDVRHELLGSRGRRRRVRSRGRLIEGPAGTFLVGTCALDAARRSGVTLVRGFARRWTRRAFFLAEASLILFETLDLRGALDRLARAVVPRMADRCEIHFLDVDGNVLRFPADGPAERVPDGAVKRVLSDGEYEFHGRLLRKDLADILPDPERFALPEEGVSSLLVLPIRASEGVAGALTFIQAESRRKMDRSDLMTFQFLARAAGLAVENGRLYEAALRREKEAAELNRDLEARVRRRTVELQEALRDLDAYASAVAHDLRSPLRALRAFSEALAQECSSLGERGKDYVGRIRSASARLDALVLDLLAYSRVGRRDLELRPVDLEDLVSEIISRMEGELRRADVRVEAPLGRVVAHRLVLGQVLTNLLSNAAKYVRAGETPRIRIRSDVKEARVRLWVEDSGLGIDPAQHQRIFKPFERLHDESAYPGTGLGLAIAQRGVERMRGDLGVESKLGQGSRFWVELDRVQDGA